RADVVRPADAGKVPHPRPEGAGLEAAALGFRQVAKDDDENIRLQFPLHDALYASASGAWNKAGVSNSRPEESDRTPPRIAGREGPMRVSDNPNGSSRPDTELPGNARLRDTTPRCPFAAPRPGTNGIPAPRGPRAARAHTTHR